MPPPVRGSPESFVNFGRDMPVLHRASEGVWSNIIAFEIIIAFNLFIFITSEFKS